MQNRDIPLTAETDLAAFLKQFAPLLQQLNAGSWPMSPLIENPVQMLMMLELMRNPFSTPMTPPLMGNPFSMPMAPPLMGNPFLGNPFSMPPQQAIPLPQAEPVPAPQTNPETELLGNLKKLFNIPEKRSTLGAKIQTLLNEAKPESAQPATAKSQTKKHPQKKRARNDDAKNNTEQLDQQPRQRKKPPKPSWTYIRTKLSKPTHSDTFDRIEREAKERVQREMLLTNNTAQSESSEDEQLSPKNPPAETATNAVVMTAPIESKPMIKGTTPPEPIAAQTPVVATTQAPTVTEPSPATAAEATIKPHKPKRTWFLEETAAQKNQRILAEADIYFEANRGFSISNNGM